MDGGDAEFLQTVSLLGCEVHRFDPSDSNASGGHLGNSLASNHGDGGAVSRHKMWLEWRAPKNRRQKKRSSVEGVSQTLADITAALGHGTVRQADIWRNGAKLTYLRVFLTQHTREALLLVCSHSNRALRHPWLPWQQFLSVWITHGPTCVLQPQDGTTVHCKSLWRSRKVYRTSSGEGLIFSHRPWLCQRQADGV